MGFMTEKARRALLNEAEEMLDPVFREVILKTEQPFFIAIRESLPGQISF
jgi:hypothetical protein